MNNSFNLHILYGLFGLCMGALLSMVGFTDFTEVHRTLIAMESEARVISPR